MFDSSLYTRAEEDRCDAASSGLLAKNLHTLKRGPSAGASYHFPPHRPLDGASSLVSRDPFIIAVAFEVPVVVGRVSDFGQTKHVCIVLL